MDRRRARTVTGPTHIGPAECAGLSAETDTTRLPAAWLGWSVSALAALLGALFLLLLVLNSRDPNVITYEYWGADAVTAIIFPAVGALIVTREPRNTLGWLFGVMGLSAAVSGFSGQYATHALVVRSLDLPGAEFAAWVSTWAGNPGFVALVLIPLLFPGGLPSSPLLRILTWSAMGAIAVSTAAIALTPGPLGRFESLPNPYEIPGAQGVLSALLGLSAAVVLIALITGILRLAVRYRHVQGVERQQLKWLVYAVTLAPLALIGNSMFPGLAWLIGGAGVALIPAAIGIAILRHQLYDIDLVINRTLVYAALTLCVATFYVAVVGYFGSVLRKEDQLLVSLVATGLVAVLFAPLRDRLQRGVNRLMYGDRDDPYTALSRMGQRLETTLAPSAVLPAAVRTVAEALRLPYVAIEVTRDGKSASYETVTSTGTAPSRFVHLPLTHQGRQVGRLALGLRHGEQHFSGTDRRLLDDLARQVGAAVHAAHLADQAVRLSTDLLQSRERLVMAREEERRRLRRDLHDGLGPQLASIAMKVEAARELISVDPKRADDLLTTVTVRAQEVVADIRRLVYGLRPPALDDFGLLGTLRSLAEQSDTGRPHVVIEAPESLPALPAAVEVACYRIAMEALSNATRHARATQCTLRLVVVEAPATLHLEIADDGGGLREDHRVGVGLLSMRERAEELGGTFEIESAAAGGTIIKATLPISGHGHEAGKEG